MTERQMAKLKRLIEFMDKSIKGNNRLIETRRNRTVFKERAEGFADGSDLVNDDLKYIRKWLGEILDDDN